MTSLIRKEIRSLFPAWMMTIVATLLIAFAGPNAVSVLLTAIAIGCLVLGITSFGAEFNQGTFSLLLAQPIPRRKIWSAKTKTLGAALLTVAIMVSVVLAAKFNVTWASVGVNQSAVRVDGNKINGGAPDLAGRKMRALREMTQKTPPLVEPKDVEMPVIFALLFLGAAFAGGLLSALTARQMAAAFWIALLFPLGICGAVGILTFNRSETTINNSMVAALAVYDVLAFLMARRQFLLAQDLPGATGVVISLPAWMHFGTRAHSATTAPAHRPLRALILKEFQLHQVSLGFAAVLLVLHVIGLIIRRMIVVPVGQQKGLYGLLGSWWLLWFVVPVMIAGVAIAEERRQATLESSLCLPASRRTQWWIKCVICFFLAILFGGVMPWLLEVAAKFIGCPSPMFMFHNPSDFADYWKFLRGAAAAAAGIALIGFYASSLARNLLQALGITILLASVLGWIVFQMFAVLPPYSPAHYQADVSLTIILLQFVLPSLFALLLWLSYLNFKHLTVGRRLWLKNASVLLVFVVLVYGPVWIYWHLQII